MRSQSRLRRFSFADDQHQPMAALDSRDMAAIDTQPPLPQHKLRWFQYSLRTLLVLVPLCAILFGWVASSLKQQQDVATLTTAKWSVHYDYEVDEDGQWLDAEPPGPAWMRNLLGIDFFCSVAGVSNPCSVTDADLKLLKSFPHLRRVEAGSWTTDLHPDRGDPITNVGLQHLKGLTMLRVLHLYGNDITDAGLQSLSGLTELKELRLCARRITDAGMEHLKGLNQLQELNLDSSQVTEEGVRQLRQALPTCEITR